MPVPAPPRVILIKDNRSPEAHEDTRCRPAGSSSLYACVSTPRRWIWHRPRRPDRGQTTRQHGSVRHEQLFGTAAGARQGGKEAREWAAAAAAAGDHSSSSSSSSLLLRSPSMLSSIPFLPLGLPPCPAAAPPSGCFRLLPLASSPVASACLGSTRGRETGGHAHRAACRSALSARTPSALAASNTCTAAEAGRLEGHPSPLRPACAAEARPPDRLPGLGSLQLEACRRLLCRLLLVAPAARPRLVKVLQRAVCRGSLG